MGEEGRIAMMAPVQKDHVDAGGGLALDASALSAYPGPAAVLDRQGRVLIANGRADPLCRAIAEGRLSDIRAGRARTTPLTEVARDLGLVD